LGEPGEIWLAEGIMDTLTLLSEGKVAVGIVGAFGFKPAWASFFQARDVVLALDADRAGQSGTAVIQSLLERAGATIHLASIPDGHDVNSYYCSTGLLPEIP
jgi:DNA primase